jgi:hypothetical protein
MYARSLTLKRWAVAGSLAGSLAALVAHANEPDSATAAAPQAASPAASRSAGSPPSVARQALEGLYRESRRSGLKLAHHAKPDNPNAYRIVVEASPFQLAFYADAGPWLAPLPNAVKYKSTTSRVGFLDVYTGVELKTAKWANASPTTSPQDYFTRLAQLAGSSSSLPKHQDRSAEVIVYTLDGNQDRRVTPADRKAPLAAATKHSLDLVLYREVHGTLLQQGEAIAKSTRTAVAHGVRTWLQPGDEFASGGRPEPVFAYWLSERFVTFDFNGDGDTSDELLFGDSSGDGRLDDMEQAALLRSNSEASTDIADNLAADARFATVTSRRPRQVGLLTRIREQHPKWSEMDAKQFLRNAIVRVDATLLIEYDDLTRKVRVRKRVLGRAHFRNALMRMQDMAQ